VRNSDFGNEEKEDEEIGRLGDGEIGRKKDRVRRR
jgi:hypothetical protein